MTKISSVIAPLYHGPWYGVRTTSRERGIVQVADAAEEDTVNEVDQWMKKMNDMADGLGADDSGFADGASVSCYRVWNSDEGTKTEWKAKIVLLNGHRMEACGPTFEHARDAVESQLRAHAEKIGRRSGLIYSVLG